MANRFPVYSRLLKLYPQQYRQDYEQPMLQTLADMLDNQSSKGGRLVVWIRAASELPIGIVQQNVTNLGESPMNKLAATSNKRLAALLAVVIVLVVAVIFRAQFGQRIVPTYASIVYGHSLSRALDDQNNALLDPLTAYYGGASSGDLRCSSQGLSGVKFIADCSALRKGYSKLPQDEAGKKSILASTAKIESKLNAQGYKAGDNGVTLSSLVGGTYEGKDYSPDAYYIKDFGKYSCTFDTYIAYSNPKPAAISGQFYCERTLYFLGASSKDIQSTRIQ